MLSLISEKEVRLVPFNCSPVIPVKWLPFIINDEPTGPDDGIMEVTDGAGAKTVKLCWLRPVCVPTVAESTPVTALAGTVTEIRVSPVRVKAAVAPLNLTEVRPVKLLPRIITVVPG